MVYGGGGIAQMAKSGRNLSKKILKYLVNIVFE